MRGSGREGEEGSTHECRKMGMRRKEFTFHIGLFILNLCAEGLHVNTVQLSTHLWDLSSLEWMNDNELIQI